MTVYGGKLAPDYPWVVQERAEECGLAALGMVARHHGRSVGLADLRPHVSLDSRGASVSALAGLAERIGLRANAVRVCPAFLPNVLLPVVAHLRNVHYVTLFAFGPLGMTVGDPARGVVRVSTAQFLADWCGAVVLLEAMHAHSRPSTSCPTSI